MNIAFYKIDCLTNLHVGSGEINYNVIDNEVEKDAVSGIPVIHASGVKGALRDALKEKCNVNDVFGAPGNGENGNAGSHKFLDAFMLSRPMRVANSEKTTSISVVSVDTVNRFLKTVGAFGCTVKDIAQITDIDFGDCEFLTVSGEDNISVEDEKTKKLDASIAGSLKGLKALIGDFAIVKSFDSYPLPVVARNCLEENKKNLWYEEVVPHGSVFYFAVIYPEDAAELDMSDIIQFGGNASIGCGYTKITRIC